MDSTNVKTMAKFLTFDLKGRPYGVPIGTVREINRLSDITPVPHVPDFVAGVINLRGRVISVVSLRKKFGYEDAAYTKSTCIVVVESGSDQIGIIVDSINGVVEFSEDQIEPPPSMGGSVAENHLIGMGKTPTSVVVLFDAAKALSGVNLEVTLTDVQIKAA